MSWRSQQQQTKHLQQQMLKELCLEELCCMILPQNGFKCKWRLDVRLKSNATFFHSSNKKLNISIFFLHLFFEFYFEAALSRKTWSCYRNLIKRRIRKKNWKTSDSAKTCPELKTASAKISSDQNLSGGRFFDLIFCKHSLENYFEIFYVLFYLNFPLSTSTS